MESKFKVASYIFGIVIAVLVTYLLCSVFTEPEVIVEMHGGRLYYNEDGSVAKDFSEEFADENDIFSENANNAFLININTASKSELMDIPNVGKETAEKIIAYREKSTFENVEEIKNIEGIGEKKFSLMKKYICVE